MGNHEYCLNCGASDFHSYRECDPVAKAKMDAERAEQKERERKQTIECVKLQVRLQQEGCTVWNKGTHLKVWPKI